MLFWLSIVAGVVVALLCWNLYKRFGADRIEAINERRRATSRLVSRGVFVDGSQHLEVALALTSSTLFYGNGDMDASLDLQWVHEVEYDTRLVTGAAMERGKVLRLRCSSRTFEFVLPDELVPRWHLMLPPRRQAAVSFALPVPAVSELKAAGAQ
jgi:hypothetical protein